VTPGEPITIKPAEEQLPRDTSPVADCALRPETTTESKAEDAKSDTKQNVPLASIPTIIGVGLLLAALYLGGRIFSARHAAKPPSAVNRVATTVAPTQVNPVAAPAKEAPLQGVPPVISAPAQLPIGKTEQTPANSTASKSGPTVQPDDDPVETISPQPGQFYIQVGALDTDAEATQRFVQRLRSEKLDPHIAPGPSAVLSRVLIGPFDDLESLKEKKAQLDSEGVDTFVRKY